MGLRHRTKMPRSVPLEEGLLTAWAMAMLCDRMRWGDEKDLSKLARKGECRKTLPYRSLQLQRVQSKSDVSLYLCLRSALPIHVTEGLLRRPVPKASHLRQLEVYHVISISPAHLRTSTLRNLHLILDLNTPSSPFPLFRRRRRSCLHCASTPVVTCKSLTRHPACPISVVR